MPGFRVHATSRPDGVEAQAASQRRTQRRDPNAMNAIARRHCGHKIKRGPDGSCALQRVEMPSSTRAVLFHTKLTGDHVIQITWAVEPGLFPTAYKRLTTSEGNSGNSTTPSASPCPTSGGAHASHQGDDRSLGLDRFRTRKPELPSQRVHTQRGHKKRTHSPAAPTWRFHK